MIKKSQKITRLANAHLFVFFGSSFFFLIEEMSSGNDLEIELLDYPQKRHQEHHTFTFVQWGRGHGEDLEEEDKKVLCQLVLFRRHFQSIIIVCVCISFLTIV